MTSDVLVSDIMRVLPAGPETPPPTPGKPGQVRDREGRPLVPRGSGGP
jgi:hypothetical protein